MDTKLGQHIMQYTFTFLYEPPQGSPIDSSGSGQEGKKEFML